MSDILKTDFSESNDAVLPADFQDTFQAMQRGGGDRISWFMMQVARIYEAAFVSIPSGVSLPHAQQESEARASFDC